MCFSRLGSLENQSEWGSLKTDTSICLVSLLEASGSLLKVEEEIQRENAHLGGACLDTDTHP